jgi:hypothetical protein
VKRIMGSHGVGECALVERLPMTHSSFEPKNGRRNHRLAFTRDESSVPVRNRHESLWSQAAQTSLAADNLVVEMRLGQGALQEPRHDFRHSALGHWKGLKMAPEILRQPNRRHSESFTVHFPFCEYQRTAAIPEARAVSVQNRATRLFQTDREVQHCQADEKVTCDAISRSRVADDGR